VAWWLGLLAVEELDNESRTASDAKRQGQRRRRKT
jgi:hypothetical protein